MGGGLHGICQAHSPKMRFRQEFPHGLSPLRLPLSQTTLWESHPLHRYRHQLRRSDQLCRSDQHRSHRLVVEDPRIGSQSHDHPISL
jgi:hypothetical protein